MADRRGRQHWIFIIIAAICAGALVYFWQYPQANAVKTQNAQLRAQLSALQATNAQLNKKLQSENPAPSQGPGQTPVATVSSCTTSQLQASVAPGSHAAGTAYQIIKLANNSRTSCTLYGFPGVSLMDAAGNLLGSPADRSGSFGSVLTLTPGRASYASVGFPDPGNFATGTCSTGSTRIRIYPPDQTTPMDVLDSQQACPGFSVSSLSATSP